MVRLPTGGSRGGGLTDGQEVHELHHVGRERHPQEAQPTWTHGVAFGDNEGWCGHRGLVQCSEQPTAQQGGEEHPPRRKQWVANGHLEKEEEEVERVCWEWWFVTGHGKMSRKFLPQTMDFAGEVPDGYLVCVADCNQPCEQSVDGVSVGWWRDGGRGGSGVEPGVGTEAGLPMDHPKVHMNGGSN